MIKKAMILAAGYGTRLTPITLAMPKALVPVGNEPMLGRHIRQLSVLGIEEVVVNGRHLVEQVDAYIGENSWGCRVTVIRESEPLGTGGGIANAARLLGGGAPFFVINSDVLHGVDLSEVARFHFLSNADATLVVRKTDPPPAPHDGIGVQDSTITYVPGVSPTGGSPLRFLGIHIAGPTLLAHLGAHGSVFSDGYARLLHDGGRMAAYVDQTSSWVDIGTPAAYYAACLDAIPRDAAEKPHGRNIDIRAPSLVHPSAALDRGSRVGPYAVICDGASVGAGATVERSVVLPGATVPSGAAIIGAIVYPGPPTNGGTPLGPDTSALMVAP